MPLPEDVKIQIGKLAISATKNKEPQQMDILNFLKDALIKEEIKASDVFEYAEKFSYKSEKSYVIHANTINKLGVAVANLKDADQKKLAIKFFKLAADRDSSWGARNYANKLYNHESPDEVTLKTMLAYAKKAVDLSSEVASEKDEHKLLYARVLRKDKEWVLANSALTDYLKFKIENLRGSSADKKNKIGSEINDALKVFQKIIDEFDADFNEENLNDLTVERCQSNVAEMTFFVEAHTILALHADSYLLLQQLYYFKGKCHEFLKEWKDAYLSYCQIKRNAKYYDNAISGIAKLLSEQIDKDLPIILKEEKSEDQNPSGEEKAALTENPEKIADKESLDTEFTLPNGLALPADFAAYWQQEHPWFYSVDEDALKLEYDKRKLQIESLVTAKETEIELVDEALKKMPEKLTEQKQKLDSELVALNKIKEDLAKKHEKYLVAPRQVFRRHVAETNFFNPRRSRKRAKIADVAKAIIGHRYNSSASKKAAIDLTGSSTRVLITAERAYQEAAIHLSSASLPQLGIPVKREKPWTVQSSYYGGNLSGTTDFGPKECYQLLGTVVEAEHRADPKRVRMGDTFVCDLESYDGIFRFLNNIIDDKIENEKQLAAWMIAYGKSHEAVTLDKLRTIHIDADQNDVDKINRFLFLAMEKEQSQWHSANNESYHLGMTVSQARCLIMLEAGFLRFKEVFKNTVVFGVYSHTKIVDKPNKVAESCNYIDKLYFEYLKQKKSGDFVGFFKKEITNKTPRAYVLSRKQAHEDLVSIYGGESDTDGDGYDSDVDKPHP